MNKTIKILTLAALLTNIHAPAHSTNTDYEYGTFMFFNNPWTISSIINLPFSLPNIRLGTMNISSGTPGFGINNENTGYISISINKVFLAAITAYAGYKIYTIYFADNNTQQPKADDTILSQEEETTHYPE